MLNNTLVYLIFFFSSISLTGILAQETLNSKLKTLKGYIQKVEASEDSYIQSIQWDEQKPYKITLNVEAIDKKGDSEENIYELSLRDLDANTIRAVADKDLMVVRMYIKKRQDLIKVLKDGEQQKYQEEVELLATDADNGESIESTLKEAIKLAEELELECVLPTYDEQLNWITNHVTSFEINEERLEQEFEKKSGNTPVFRYKKTTEAKKSFQEVWEFNMADLDARKMKLTVKDKELWVELNTKKGNKYIGYWKDAEQESYQSKMHILAEDLEAGQCLIENLEAVISSSEEINKKLSPMLDKTEKALKSVVENVSDVSINEDQWSQNIEPMCVTSLTITDEKSKENIYKFNYSDIAPNSIDILVKNNKAEVEFSTGKNKLIQAFEDEKLDNYTNDISIKVSNIENAKLLQFSLKKATEFCKEEGGFTPFETIQKNLTWISQQLEKVNIEGIPEQSLTSLDDKCKWQFKVVESSKKGDSDEVYEFDLSDLNKNAIDFDISGKNLSIVTQTNGQEKVIKYYKNGEPEDYQNEIEYQLQDIEVGRNMIQVLKKSINICGK